MSDVLTAVIVFIVVIVWLIFSIFHLSEYRKTKDATNVMLSNLYSIASTMLTIIYLVIKTQ